MNIAVVASEAFPFSKTGGLADVTGTLYKEYAGRGLAVHLFVPLYKKTWERFKNNITYTGIELDITLGKAVRACKVFTLKGNAGKENHNVYFIGNDEFFDREELYGTSFGDYPDNDQRFIFFCRSVLEFCRQKGMQMDVMHCSDWQTGLVPYYLKTLYRDVPAFRNTRSVMTIHNLGYQGIFGRPTLEMTGLGEQHFKPEAIEFYGNVNFLKAGIIGADIITTVSTTYAKEILTPEYGFGLDGVLRQRAASIVGILNGVDYEEWDPATDKMLPFNYSASGLAGKAKCKEALMKYCSFKGGLLSPLFCFIGRLSGQKGIDLLSAVIPGLIANGMKTIIIGKGEKVYHTLLDSLKDRYPDDFFFYSGFDEAIARLCYAGSDIFLMPSKYEPCGLGQLIAMHYGTIPVARRTGGISDTVTHGRNGFLFDSYSAGGLNAAIKEAVDIYADGKAWKRIIRTAMKQDFSWKKSADMYLTTYSGKTQ